MRLAHATDAHFVCYGLVDGSAHPRIKKVCLPHIRKAGSDVVMRFLAVDIDRPGHEPWTDAGDVAELLELVRAYSAHWWACSDWSYFYTTRAGCRFVYTLSEPLSPEEWEHCARSLIAVFKREGFDADPQCKDWTRIFRLPDTMRDGEQQGEQPWFVLMEQPEARLDARTRCTDANDWNNLFPKHSIDQEALDIRDVGNRPSEEDAYALLFRKNKQGREIQTEWYRNAKNALKGQPYFSALFEHAPFAEEGERDDTLLRTAGSVIGLLYDRFGTTITHVYGLLLEAVSGLEPDSGTPNWADATWTKVERIWAKEEAKSRVLTKKDEQALEGRKSTESKLVEGMKEWCDHPDLQVGPDGSITDKAADFLFKHLLAMPSSGRECYVLRLDGHYDTLPCNPNTLLSRIRALHGDEGVFTLRVQNEKSSRWVTPYELMNAHATPVRALAMRASTIMGGTISDIDTDRAVLHVSPFGRAALNPTYNGEVDEWLKLLFGDNYAAACRWIAWSLAFEEGPICALSVCGPSGIGKTMLVEGLKECLAVPAASEFSELTGQWQYGLVNSPWVFTDEGFDLSHTKAHPADVFRRLVGRHNININRKNLAPMDVKTDVRICFTANNHSLIRALTSHREVTPEDREALMIRLLHFDLSAKAADWLVLHGGRKFTRRWISDGRESDFVVARHFLWLHEQRESFIKDDRLLVEGNMDEEVMNELRLHSGAMDLVVEAVARMIDSPENSKRRGETRVSPDEVYVLVKDVHHYITQDLGHRLAIGAVRDLLTSLLPAGAIDHDGQVKVKAIDGDRRRWYSIDLQFMKDTCREYGWTLGKLNDPENLPIPDAPPFRLAAAE
jgi:hypothetical protein